LGDLHYDSRHPVWWPRQILQLANRGHLVHGAVGEYHRRELPRFTGGQTELDPEELTGSDLSATYTTARFCSSEKR
jgi:hypothetical protein